ncbi:MAG: hypothetical protein BWY70_01433 [Bacteroidetes bacterium ADurb.Bin408]|nr:MAG: hypothetical protein BWY70_01433 [Bacteroidetes bacterium ADurb.Bin408]
MALADDAQAEVVVKLGPVKPYFMEMWPAAISDIILGMKNGLKRGISLPLTYPMTSSKKVVIPPMPDPQITPMRSRSVASRFSPLSFMASSVETRAYCENRSCFLTSFLSKNRDESKFFNSQANCVLKLLVSNFVAGAAPLTPLSKPFQYSGTELPIGVSAPNPVTTTLLMFI